MQISEGNPSPPEEILLRQRDEVSNIESINIPEEAYGGDN